jgi:transcriptional regulator with XRE-family HTH domain
VRHEVIGRGLRALRHRRRLRQADVARTAGVARSVIGDLEAGRLEAHALGALGRVASALGGWIRIDLSVPGGELHRLLDADHAAIQNAWKMMLEHAGWRVEAEVTFNHFGERGSIDLFAWHESTRSLLVIEIKSIIVDVQALLAGLDRKVRIGRAIAGERGMRAVQVLPVLLVAEGSTARRRIHQHAALFGRLSLRGRAAAAWLRNPAAGGATTGILLLTKLPAARPDGARRAGRQRIRARRA